MSNQSSDLPSSESPVSSSNHEITPSASPPPLGLCGSGMSEATLALARPNSAVRGPVGELNAVESRIDTRSANSTHDCACRHASASCSATAAAASSSSATAGACLSPVFAKCQRVEAHHPQPLQVQQVASATAEPGELRGEEVSGNENTPQDTAISHDKDTAIDKMCIAESSKAADSKASSDNKGNDKTKEGGSNKMYEIPLTILPKAETQTSRSKNKKHSKHGSDTGTSGRWTHQEHQAFLDGLKVYGREWKKVAEKIPTRTSAQIRSHAQKYFSKLAREEAMALHEPATVAQLPSTIAGTTAMGAPAPLLNGQDGLPHSVQRTAERILANPTGAQQEVEETLRQLRERYRQLQIRLEQSQGRNVPPLDRIVEDGGSDNDGVVPAGFIPRGGHAPGVDRRKRSLDDAFAGAGAGTLPHAPHGQHDDGSSVSSDLSASLASLSTSREFGDEELIALHVLGGTLPRSASETELHHQAQAQSSSFSDTEGGDDASSESKRQKLAEESNHHPAPHGGDDRERDHDGDEAML